MFSKIAAFVAPGVLALLRGDSHVRDKINQWSVEHCDGYRFCDADGLMDSVRFSADTRTLVTWRGLKSILLVDYFGDKPEGMGFEQWRIERVKIKGAEFKL